MTYIKCVFFASNSFFTANIYVHNTNILIYNGHKQKHWHLNYERIFSHEIFTSETGTQSHFKYLINTNFLYSKSTKNIKNKIFCIKKYKQNKNKANVLSSRLNHKIQLWRIWQIAGNIYSFQLCNSCENVLFD